MPTVKLRKRKIGEYQPPSAWKSRLLGHGVSHAFAQTAGEGKPMNKKEEFLRAIQRIHMPIVHDPALIFRWALNLKVDAIPDNIQKAARKFVKRLSE